jgi:hypothetical protein
MRQVGQAADGDGKEMGKEMEPLDQTKPKCLPGGIRTIRMDQNAVKCLAGFGSC